MPAALLPALASHAPNAPSMGSPITFNSNYQETATVASDHQCTENLESLWSAAALSECVFHGIGGKPDWVNRAERLWEIHVATDSDRDRRARQRERGDPKAPAAQLCGAGLAFQS